MSYAFNGNNPNLNYAVNMLNKQQFSIIDVLNTLGNIGDLVGGTLNDLLWGAGSQGTAEKVEEATKWMINKASHQRITYSQQNRHLKQPNGKSFDCSSFVITGYYAVGVDINATSTRNMRAGFTAKGWKWIPGKYWPASKLRRGDILLAESNHTQVYIGNNRDVNCGHTPASTCPHTSNNYGRGWDGILRYVETNKTVKIPASVNQSGLIADYTANYGTRGWNTSSKQYKVWKKWNAQGAGSKYADNICILQARYLVAVRPVFGTTGDKINIYLENGIVIHAIIADVKGSDATSKYGHVIGGKVSVIEWEAHTTLKLTDLPANWRNKKVTKIVNQGSIL